MPPVEHLLLAMRRLFQDDVWSVNVAGGVGWVIGKDLYLVWPQAFDDLLRHLDADRVPGIPRQPETMAKLLAEYGVISTEAGHWLYTIAPQSLKESSHLQAVRIHRAQRVIAPLPPSAPGRVFQTESDAQQIPTQLPDPVKHHPSSQTSPVAEMFLSLLRAAEPPFPVRVIGVHPYVAMGEAVKWFREQGMSQSQMLRLVKNSELGLIKINNGSQRLIGPPSR